MSKYKLIFFISILIYNIKVGAQIKDKWFLDNIYPVDSALLVYEDFIPRLFSVSDSHIYCYTLLDDIISLTEFKSQNLKEDSIKLGDANSREFLKIDDITDCKLVLKSKYNYIVYYKLLKADFKKGSFEICTDEGIKTETTTRTPIFERDFNRILLKYFAERKFFQPYSSLIKVEFIVRKNKTIDSINVDSDNPEIKKEMELFLKSTSKYWYYENRLKYKEISDCTVGFDLIILTENTKTLLEKNATKLSSPAFLFDKGNKYLMKHKYNQALFCFTESISFSKYLYSLYYYDIIPSNERYSLNLYNNILFNRAITYINLNKINNACEDWKTILKTYPTIEKDYAEAQKMINNYCNK